MLTSYINERGPLLASDRARETLAYNVQALAPFWGDLTVSDITDEKCNEYYKERNVKPATAARELSVLSAAIKHDFKRRRLTYPVQVWMPKVNNHKTRFLSRKEVADLLRAMKKTRRSRHLMLFTLLAIYTGQRKGAILELQWSQVDMVNGYIDFNPAGHKETNKGRTKTKIHRRLMTFMRYHQKTAKGAYVVSSNGKKLGEISKSFSRACKRAGIEGVSPHTLRHTVISWAKQKGVDDSKVAAFVGHKTTRMLPRYAHLDPNYQNDVLEAI